MKKLIINEKNLPKIGKSNDSNIRIRINKTQNNHETSIVKKTVPAQLQEIDYCIEALQNCFSKNQSLDEQATHLIMQVLKSYKDVLNPNQELMTQSLKFSKLKFKGLLESEDKQNQSTSPILSKFQKNTKQVPSSDRVSRLAQKTSNSLKNPKMRKYVSMHKKNSQENDLKDQTLNIGLTSPKVTRLDDQLAESMQQSTQGIKSLQMQSRLKVESIIEQVQRHSAQVSTICQQSQSLANLLQKKNEEINQLHQRIQQLNTNIQSLLKKNTEKYEDYNKLFEEHQTSKEVITRLEQKIEQIRIRVEQMQKDKAQLIKQKERVDLQKKSLQLEKKQKVQQQLGRYETAQHFYELTRKDLSQQNQQLRGLLQQRETQLINLYQVVRTFQEQKFTNYNKKQEFFTSEFVV